MNNIAYKSFLLVEEGGHDWRAYRSPYYHRCNVASYNSFSFESICEIINQADDVGEFPNEQELQLAIRRLPSGEKHTRERIQEWWDRAWIEADLYLSASEYGKLDDALNKYMNNEEVRNAPSMYGESFQEEVANIKKIFGGYYCIAIGVATDDMIDEILGTLLRIVHRPYIEALATDIQERIVETPIRSPDDKRSKVLLIDGVMSDVHYTVMLTTRWYIRAGGLDLANVIWKLLDKLAGNGSNVGAAL